jgi:hypothetical protein
LVSQVTAQAEKRKRAVKEAFEKKRKKIIEEIRHRRYLVSQGKEEYKGKNNRKQIVYLTNYLSELEVQTSHKVDSIDAAKHRIQDKKTIKHKRWSF